MKKSFVLELVWNLACIEVYRTHWPQIEPEHFLLAMVKLSLMDNSSLISGAASRKVNRHEVQAEINLAPKTLRKGLAIHPKEFVDTLQARLGQKDLFHPSDSVIHRSRLSLAMFEKAEEIARHMPYVGEEPVLRTGHLIIAAFRMDTPILKTMIAELGFQHDRLITAVELYLKGMTRNLKQSAADANPAVSTPTLDKLGRDLTALAAQGKLGPFFGRNSELRQLIEILARKGKNNPVLIGEAGVGKTAIVEALAVQIHQDQVPEFLAGRRIVEVSIGSLVAGTKYRGDFEGAVRDILSECNNSPNLILFIDELHTLVGAGLCEGQVLDAANMFKPALARGNLRCIGATTQAEYRRHVESDPALERRFEKVVVTEPSPEETGLILQGLRRVWEAHHGVAISDMALQAAVELSVRFDGDHQLPDKAIDLIDRAAASVRVREESLTEISIMTLVEEETDIPELTEEDISQVLAIKLNLPVELLLSEINLPTRIRRLVQIEGLMKQRIIGQDEAIEALCRRLQVAYAALTPRRGPLSVLLFLGPSGVGKTETASCLAEFLFGSPRNLLRLDMSEFMQEQSIARLIGAPPGYAGYSQDGQLSAHLRSKPYSLVLLDEIDKAHPRVWDLFLQVFDEGRLTDARGRSVDVRHAIVIMTSNLGGKVHYRFGFGQSDEIENRQEILAAATSAFRPEFLNRIDEILAFRALNRNDAETIARKLALQRQDAFAARVKGKLEIGEEVLARIVQEGYSPEYGARQIRRCVEQHIDVPLARWMAEDSVPNLVSVHAVLDGSKVVVRERNGFVK